MATRKTKISQDEILRTIEKLTVGRIAEIDLELASNSDPNRFQVLHRERRRLSESGCDYLVDVLSGRKLDIASRKAWQRVVIELEASSLVAIEGIRGSKIKLTRKGKKYLSDASSSRREVAKDLQRRRCTDGQDIRIPPPRLKA